MGQEQDLTMVSGVLKSTAARPLAGASARSAIEPFRAMDVLRAAVEHEAAGHSVIHMEVGQPGTPAPKPVLEAARIALEDGRFGYTEALGHRTLRSRIAAYYGEMHGLDLPADRIAVTTGSSAGFNLAFLAAFDPGGRIGLANPGYPAYRNLLSALGLEPVAIETPAESGYVITPEALERCHAATPLAGILVASPANPTGTMMHAAQLGALIEAAEGLGIRFISDEIYHRLVYGEPAETALKFSDAAFVVNSFSKYYCMTGWRIGWMVVPEDLVRPVERLAQNLYISPPDISQRAAIAAFDATAELEAVRRGCAANRQLLLERMPALGFDDYFPVDGAFYFYASVRHFSNDSVDFARRMLTEAGVAATPGPDFDPVTGHGHVRFSFAGEPSAIEEAVDRLGRWLQP